MNKILASALVALLLLSFAAGLVGVWQIKPVCSTSTFEDGFESNDFTAWDSAVGSPTIATSQVRNGLYSCQTDGDGEYVTKGGFSLVTAFVRLNIYFNLLENNMADQFLWLFGGSNRVVRLTFKKVYNGSDYVMRLSMQVRHVDSSYEESGLIGTFATGNWYRIEIYFKKNTVGGGALWVDGVNIWNMTTTSDNANADTLYVGSCYAEGAPRQCIDDVVIADVYIGAPIDTTAPTFSSNSVNNTIKGVNTMFSTVAHDFSNVSMFIFCTNNTGHFVNNTAVAFTVWVTGYSAWTNATKTLNTTAGVKVAWRLYANDTLGNMGVSTTWYVVVEVDLAPTFESIHADTTYAGDAYLMVLCVISDAVKVSTWGYAWNNTGAYANNSKTACNQQTVNATFYGTWNATVGVKVGVQFWANDSLNQAVYSPLQLFLLTTEPIYKYRIFINSTATYRRTSVGVIDDFGTSLAVINKAITDCNSAGYGNISIYKGTYPVAGTIVMKSHVDIWLRNGTLLDHAGNNYIMSWISLHYSSLQSTANGTIRGAGTAGFNNEACFVFYNVDHITIGATKNDGFIIHRIGAWLSTQIYSNGYTNNSVFKNIYAYDWGRMNLYHQHGWSLDHGENVTFSDMHIDGNGGGDTRSPILIGGQEGISHNITIDGGTFENSKYDNGIYLGGWEYGVYDILIKNVVTYHNNWGWSQAHSGIKFRPACNVTILNWTSINDYSGLEISTVMSDESSAFMGGGSWYNYIQGRIYSPTLVGAALDLDSGGTAPSVRFNTLLLEVFNASTSNAVWLDNGRTGGSLVNDNTVYLNATGCYRAGITMSDSSSGPIANNDFYCRFVQNGAYGFPDIVIQTISVQTNNNFYVYSAFGNPNGLMNFVNGTNGNIVYYPYTGTRSLEILWHTVSTTVVGAVCNFSAYWVGDIGLSFGWLCTNITGVMANQTAIALTSYADTFVDSATLPLVVGEGVAYIFYANDTGGLTQISATFFLTTTPIPHYYFSWNFKDRDNSNVNSILTYALYDGIIPVPYVKGVANLTAGTYTLVAFYYGYYVNDTALDTATQGNTTVNIPLEMKHHTIITNGYLVFDEAVTSLVINEQTHYNLTFTVTTTSTNIYIRVPANASFFTIDGTNRTYGGLWTYDDANGVILVDGGYTTYQIGLESWSAPNVSLTQFIIIVFLALGLLGFAPLILVALVLQKKIEPVPVILMITIMVITFAVLYLVVANLMNVV